MLLAPLRNGLRRLARSRAGHRPTAPRYQPALDVLEDRTVPSTTGLHIVPSPIVNHSFLNATAAIAPNDVWAVGEFTNPSTGLFQPLAEHFNGTTWSVVLTPALPAGTFGQLYGVTAVASNNVWAVGVSGNTDRSPLIEHFDGTKWSIVANPSSPAGGWLNAVTALSATDVWAVGLGNLIEHYNGIRWSIVSAPNAGSFTHANLFGVSGTSSTDVWAVGSIGRHSSVETLHWNGQAWSVVAAPSPAFDSALRSVVALAPNNVWAVGQTNVGPTQTLIEHFDGTRWSVVPSPSAGGTASNANNALSGVAAASASNIWAVGVFTDPSTGFERTLTEHFDGANWSVVPSPNATGGHNVLNGVAALSSGDVVAVGYATTANGQTNNLILRR